MTVQNTNTKNIYVGDGITKVFPYTFQIAGNHVEYIKVYIEADGITTETKDFAIDVNSKNITYPLKGSALPANQKIIIARQIPLVQMLNLVNQGAYFAEDIEAALDECIMICQQIKESLDRTFSIPITMDVERVDTTLPYKPGKSFAWDKEQMKLVLTENPADILPLVEAETNSLKEYVVLKTQEIAELVASLSNLTREELQKLRDECEEFAQNAEQSALVNTRWPVSDTRKRPSWKNDYGIEGQDLLLTVPRVVKVNVIEE